MIRFSLPDPPPKHHTSYVHPIPGLLHTIDKAGNSHLHLAAKAGDLHCVATLLRDGLSMAATNHEGNTPLHLATQYGHHNVVRYLLQQGADSQCRNTLGETPHNLAINNDLTALISLFERATNVRPS